MNEESYTYQTPQEKLHLLMKDIASDFKKAYPNLTRQDLVEIWRNSEKDLERLQK